jgi:putative spermidine/putrescine transport system substrate-binding protein
VKTRLCPVALLALLASALVACGGGSSPDDDDPGGPAFGDTGSAAPGGGGLTLTKDAKPVTIQWASTGGDSQAAEKKHLHDPFTAATGNKFNEITPADQAQIRAMEQSGNVQWDVANVGPPFTYANCGKLFAPIDKSLYQDLNKYDPATLNRCLVPTFKYANLVSYNTDKFKSDPPTSIKDFFDTKKYPGKRLTLDSATNGLYETALVADGVDPAKLYPLDIQRAQKKLDTIKDDLTLTPTYGAAQQALANGEASMALMVTTRTQLAIRDGAHLAPLWDFTTYGLGGFAVLKNAPHMKQAQQAAAFAATREANIAYCAAGGYAPANPTIPITDVPFTSLQKQFNAFTTDRGRVVLQSPTWYAANSSALVLAFTKWKVG